MKYAAAIDDVNLTLYNPPEYLFKKMTCSVRNIVMGYKKGRGFGSDMVNAKEELFSYDEANKSFQCYSGYWQHVSHILKDHKDELVLAIDNRSKLPFPALHKMFGFRFSQGELLTKFLIKQQSGLLGAPTRYGKTTLMINTIRAYEGIPICVTLPGTDLIRQMADDIKEKCPEREVKIIGAGSTNKHTSNDITVASIDSLGKVDRDKVKLLLIDEPHAVPSASRIDEVAQFPCRKLGFGATLTGRFDGRDIMTVGAIGPVLEERTYKEAVAEGAIAPLKVLMLQTPFDNLAHDRTRDAAYSRILLSNANMARLHADLCNHIPKDWQMLSFVKNEASADLFMSFMPTDTTIAMAKKMTNAERKAVTEKMVSGNIKRCLASNIYAQGVTFSDVRLVINLCGGGNTTNTIQKPGRLAEIRPWKNYGCIIDFMFMPKYTVPTLGILPNKGATCMCMYHESRSRKKAYEEKGYEVIEVGSILEMIPIILNSCNDYEKEDN